MFQRPPIVPFPHQPHPHIYQRERFLKNPDMLKHIRYAYPYLIPSSFISSKVKPRRVDTQTDKGIPTKVKFLNLVMNTLNVSTNSMEFYAF